MTCDRVINLLLLRPLKCSLRISTNKHISRRFIAASCAIQQQLTPFSQVVSVSSAMSTFNKGSPATDPASDGSVNQSQKQICDHTQVSSTGTVTSTQWRTLETQVGGHQFAHGEYDQHQKLGMVDFGNGLVLKSLQNPPRGIRELGFYRRVFDPNCDDAELNELRQFLPPFYGTEEKGSAKFLKLANLTSGFKQPCVIDLKIGKVTYDQEATAEKIEHEVKKYPPLKDLGFQITGMMIYNPETQSVEHYGRSYCRNLTVENIVSDGLGLYFRLNSSYSRRDAIQPLLSKLKKLESWFLKQRKLSFVASSLLIVYEGSKSTERKISPSEKMGLPQNENKDGPTLVDHSSNNLSNVDSHANSETMAADVEDCNSGNTVHTQKRVIEKQLNFNDETVKKIKLSDTADERSGLNKNEVYTEESSSETDLEVHLIDFAHVFPADDIDHNFLFGLQKVIACLQTLLT